MRQRRKIFKTFTHDRLKNVGAADGKAGAAFLLEAVTNTNRLIAEGLHVPPLHPSHQPESEASFGWNQHLETDGTSLFSDIEWTEEGAKSAGTKYRWLSTGFRRDFNKTGETGGEIIPGVYVHHVAMLGATPPQVKGLVDLASAAELSEGDTLQSGHTYFSVDQSSGEMCYFAEIETPNSGNPTATTKKANTEGKMTEQEELQKLRADFAESERKRKDAETSLADVKKKEARAGFVSQLADFAGNVKGSMKKLTMGKTTADLAKQLHGLLVLKSQSEGANFSESDNEAMFATAGIKYDPNARPEDILVKFVESLQPILPSALAAHFSESEANDEGVPMPSSADFSEQAGNPVAAQKVDKAVAYIMRKGGITREEAYRKVRASAGS